MTSEPTRLAPPARSKQMKGKPTPEAGTLHSAAPSSGLMSLSRGGAPSARFDLSSAPSQAGAITSAGPERKPAAMESRRRPRPEGFSCRSRSPRAFGRGGFVRMNIAYLQDPVDVYCKVTAALPSTAVQAAAPACETVALALRDGIFCNSASTSLVTAVATCGLAEP